MPETAIAVAVAFISFLAFIVSVCSLWIQRTHNRKSVRPIGHIQLHDSLQGLHVKLVNKGVGPLLVKEFIAVRNAVIKHNIVYHLPEHILDGFTHEFHTEPEGYWLIPGDELTLLQLEGDHLDKKFAYVRENVRSILSEINVNLIYCDIYDHKHPVFRKSFSLFKRTL